MITQQEEKDARKLRILARRLHVPVPEVFWMLEVFDKTGNLLSTHHQRSHSWTRNAYNHFFVSAAAKSASDNTWAAGKLSLKTTAGVIKFNALFTIAHAYNQDLDSPDVNDGILTPAGQVTKGIVVGSGLDAESFEDYKLQTPIAEGVGAGQLNAVASNLHSISYGALVLADEQVRYFNNNSGGDVSINEVAIYDGIFADNVVQLACMVRDHLGATVTLPDTGQCKVTYTFQLTYPA